MKIILYLLFMFSLCQSFAQQIGEQVIYNTSSTNELKQDWDLFFNEERNEIETIRYMKIISPTVKELDRGKVYHKIVFGGSQPKFQKYFRGKLRKRSLDRQYYTFDIMGDIRYMENDSLFAHPNIDRKGNLSPEEPIYYPNGKVKSYSVRIGKDSWRQVRYFPDGNIDKVYDLNSFETIPIKHPRYGDVYEKYWSYEKEMLPNVLTNRSGASYVGYPHIGSLHTTSGYILTGFHYPLDVIKGNGSVLFLENEKTGKCFWVLVIDKVIREMVPATKDEKPDIIELANNTNTQVFLFGKNELSTEEIKKLNIPISSKNSFRFTQNFAQIQTKGIENFTGYGIDLNYVDHTTFGDSITLRVGFFKNGKLDGLGYAANLQYDVGFDPKATQYNKILAISWYIDHGKFAGGELASGRTIIPGIALTPTTDVFSEMPYRGFVWRSHKPSWTVTNKMMSFSELSPTYYVYSTKLNRTLKVLNFDRVKKLITVETDKPGITYTFNALNSAEIYGFQPKFVDYRAECPKTVTVENFVRKDVPIYTYTPVSYLRRVVHGVDYDKIITTKIEGAPKSITMNKVVSDGYRTEVCPICKGTGFIQKTKQQGAFCRINFLQ